MFPGTSYTAGFSYPYTDLWVYLVHSRTIGIIVLFSLPIAAAQAPNTDFAAWPSGLLTLVTSLYMGSTLALSSLEENDPISSFRRLGVLDWFTSYRRSHDYLGSVDEVWLEPTSNIRSGSEFWSGRTQWQDQVQYSVHIARVRGDAAQPVVSHLRNWAMDAHQSREKVKQSASQWKHNTIQGTTNLTLSAMASQTGDYLATSFTDRLAGYSPSAVEYSLICQCLAEYSDCSEWFSLSDNERGHTLEARIHSVLKEAGLAGIVTSLGHIRPWFMDGNDNDTVRALYVALLIRSRYQTHQRDTWSSSKHPGDSDLEQGITKDPTTEQQIDELCARSANFIFTWRPLNFAGSNRSLSVLAFIWGVRHFGSTNLKRANPGEMIALSLLSGIGFTYKSLGIRFPSQVCPTSPEQLANSIIKYLDDPIEETGSWIGVLPITRVLYYGRLCILMIIVAFFVSLGSGASAWMCLALSLAVLPRDDPFTSPQLAKHINSFPWPTHTVSGLTQPSRGLWMIGMEYHKPYHGKYASPSLPIILVGLGTAVLAHVQQVSWRPALGFAPLVPPSRWIQWTSIGLSTLLAVVQCAWYVIRALGHGPASRREGLLATRLSIISGIVTLVICILRTAGTLGMYARYIAEGTLCLTTLPFFIMYTDGPVGEREGGCRILYMWQWSLAGTVSLTSTQ